MPHLSPHVELEYSLGDGAALEGLVRPLLLGKLARRRHRGEVHRLEDVAVQSSGPFAFEGHAHLAKNEKNATKNKKATAAREELLYGQYRIGHVYHHRPDGKGGTKVPHGRAKAGQHTHSEL